MFFRSASRRSPDRRNTTERAGDLERALVGLASAVGPATPQDAAKTDVVAERIHALTHQVLVLGARAPPLKIFAPEPTADGSAVVKALAKLVGLPSSPLAASTLRLSRHLLADASVVRAFLRAGFDFLVAHSLEKPPARLEERMQALKWLRRVLRAAPELLTPALAHSVVAVCHKRDDNLRRVGLETLREMAMVRPDLAARANGMRDLFDAVLDTKVDDMAESIMMTLLFLLNGAETRKFVRSHVAVQKLVSTYTDLDSAKTVEVEQWRSSRNALVMAFRSYTGIFLLASDPHALRSLLSLLPDPSVEDTTQHAIVDTLVAVLEPVLPILGAPTELAETTGDGGAGVGGTPQAAVAGLLDPYAALLVGAFLRCGLVEGLTVLGLRARSVLAKKASRLLVTLLRIAKRVCPEDRATALWSMTEYMDTAIGAAQAPDGAGAEAVTRAFQTLELLSTVSRQSLGGASRMGLAGGRMDSQLALGGYDSVWGMVEAPAASEVEVLGDLVRYVEAMAVTAPSVPHASRAAQRILSHQQVRMELKLKLEMVVDRGVLADQLNRSRVLATKNWREWDWRVVSDMLDSTLANQERLAEALRSKFIKRLSGFFRCQADPKSIFARLPWSHEHLRYVRCGCQLYTLLTGQAQGREFLRQDKRGAIFREVASELETLLLPGARPSAFFQRTALMRSMSREYFTIIGAVSETSEGRALLAETRLFDMLQQIGGRSDLDHICRIVLTSLDYSSQGFFSRSLLEMWMTQGSRSLRLYGTSVLRALLRSHVADFEDWGVDVLVSQLHLDEPEVVTAALSVLEEAAMNDTYLESIVAKKPSLVRYESARPLLQRFASCEAGLAYLREHEWLDYAVDLWRGPASVRYLNKVELALARILCEANRTSFETGDAMAQSLTPGDAAGFGEPPRSIEAATRVQTPISVCFDTPQGGTVLRNELHSLLCLPWGARLRVATAQGVFQDIPVDCFLEASAVRPPHLSDSADPLDTGALRVRLEIVGGTRTLDPDATVEVALRIGARPVDRFGNLAEIDLQDRPASGRMSQGESHTPPRLSEVGKLGSSAFSGTSSAPSLEDEAHGDGRALPTMTSFQQFQSSQLYRGDDPHDWCTFGPRDRRAAMAKLRNGSAPTAVDPSDLAGNDFWAAVSGSPARFVFAGGREAAAAKFEGPWRLKAVDFIISLDGAPTRNVPLPVHLLGEVAQTESGCRYLRRAGIAAELLEASKGTTTPVAETDEVTPRSTQRRAALWAVGHIGGSDTGWLLLQSLDSHFLDDVLRAVTHDQSLSLRGTAFAVLGLLSRSATGADALALRGWDRAAAESVGVCLPAKLERLFRPVSGDFDGSPALAPPPYSPVPLAALAARLTAPEQDVYTHISRLANHIQQKQASSHLMQLYKSEDTRGIFRTPRLLLLVHYLLSGFRFSLAMRRFILGLFYEAGCELDVNALDGVIREVQRSTSN